jgi:hypothetical protein
MPHVVALRARGERIQSGTYSSRLNHRLRLVMRQWALGAEHREPASAPHGFQNASSEAVSQKESDSQLERCDSGLSSIPCVLCGRGETPSGPDPVATVFEGPDSLPRPGDGR